MERIQFVHAYEGIISVENLLEGWKEFVRRKRKREDVQEFGRHLMANIISLHRDLAGARYRHGPYEHFTVFEPKRRDIHKACVRDRVLHRALYRRLYPFFDRTFIADSFSCRIGKGTHAAMNRFRAFAYKASRNHTRTCFVLKCDIRKFFANIDHRVLFSVLARYIPNADILYLLKNIVGSFNSTSSNLARTDGRRYVLNIQGVTIGLPLGNLTSQLLVNIYMNEFDQFVKHKLKVKYYIRYADDFVLLSHERTELEGLLPLIETFLRERLKLSLHPDKVFIKATASGVDFLGWVHFPGHRVLRTSTKRRIFRTLAGSPKEESVQSYLGLLSHGNAYMLQQKIQSS